MTASARIQCSAAGRFRDRHMVTDRQYHVTGPNGELYTFCSACCLLYFACHGLSTDRAPGHPMQAGTYHAVSEVAA
jgi:hypothetical protein